MQSRSWFEEGRTPRMVSMVVAIAFLAFSFVAIVPTARASSSLIGAGTFIFTSLTITDCTPVPGTDLTTCTFDFTGTFHGTISGPFTAVSTVTESPSAGTPAGGTLRISATGTCSPCEVAGLTGSLTLLFSFSGIEALQTFRFPMSIPGGTGGLAGVSGSGSMLFIPNYPVYVEPTMPYNVTLTLP